jgi:hypothetical protein
MRFYQYLLTLLSLVVLGISSGAEPTITPDNRSLNRTDYGICWWCCMEMVAKEHNIPGYANITDLVVKDGLGFKEGATHTTIHAWAEKQKVKMEFHEGPARDHRFVLNTIWDRKLPVVTSNYWSDDGVRKFTHAILVVDITDNEVEFIDEDNVARKTYRVRYIDPNCVDKSRVCQKTWEWWYTSWTGRCCVLDPLKQEVRTARSITTPTSDAPKHEGLQHKQVPAYLPQLPLDVSQTHTLGHTQLISIPSNQDIQDGVQRPNDCLYSGCYHYFADYYLPIKK